MLTGTECRKTSIDLDQRFREGSFLKKIFWCSWRILARCKATAPRLCAARSHSASGLRPQPDRTILQPHQAMSPGSRRDTISLPPITLPSSSLHPSGYGCALIESTSEINGCPACIHVNLSVRASLPVCPDKRTFPRSGRMRRIVRKRTVHRIWSFRLAKPRVRCLR